MQVESPGTSGWGILDHHNWGFLHCNRNMNANYENVNGNTHSQSTIYLFIYASIADIQ